MLSSSLKFEPLLTLILAHLRIYTVVYSNEEGGNISIDLSFILFYNKIFMNKLKFN